MTKLTQRSYLSKNIRPVLIATGLIFLASQSTVAIAKDRGERGDRGDRSGRSERTVITEAIQAGQLMNVKQIAEIVEKEVQGSIIEIELDHKYNVLAYKVKVVDNTGARRRLELDAKTGEILSRY